MPLFSNPPEKLYLLKHVKKDFWPRLIHLMSYVRLQQFIQFFVELNEFLPKSEGRNRVNSLVMEVLNSKCLFLVKLIGLIIILSCPVDNV